MKSFLKVGTPIWDTDMFKPTVRYDNPKMNYQNEQSQCGQFIELQSPQQSSSWFWTFSSTAFGAFTIGVVETTDSEMVSSKPESVLP